MPPSYGNLFGADGILEGPQQVTQGLQKAGDVVIDNATITTAQGQTFNMLPQIRSIEIYEDIFAPFLTGSILLEDAQDLLGLGPIVGEEKLSFGLRTPSLEKEDVYNHVFFVTKLSEHSKRKRSSTYRLHFISREGITDLNTKSSRAYQGRCHDIANDIVTSESGLQSLKPFRMEASTNDIKFISNFWSPLRSLQYVCERSLNNRSQPSYIFFENRNGLNFVSLDYLKYLKTVHEFVVADSKSKSEMPENPEAMAKSYREVLEYKNSVPFNYYDKSRSGAMGAEVVYFDLLTHQYTHNRYEPLKDHKRLNEFPGFSQGNFTHSKSTLLYGHQYYNNFEGYGELGDGKVLAHRTCLLSEIETQKCLIRVKGRTDYTVGQKVSLKVPKSKQIKKNEKRPWCGQQSGKYLVGAIKHIINQNNHECVMELIKDSYITDLDNHRN